MKPVWIGAMLLSMASCAVADRDHRKPPEPQQAAPATKTKPAPPRRAVPMTPMTIERAPAPAAAIPRVPSPVVPPQQPVPPAPSAITACDSGGCWSGGNRYNGSGGTYLDRNGRLCQSNGAFMQCF